MSDPFARQKVRRTIEIDPSDVIDTPVTTVIKLLTEKLAEAPETADTVFFNITPGDYDESHTVTFYYMDDETDIEYSRRIDRIKNERQRQYMLYQKLKEQFEGGGK